MTIEIKKISAVILCGGLGKRLRKVVSDRPKCMALINKRPFLDILIEYLTSFGITDIVLCCGYKAEVIKQHFQSKEKDIQRIFFSEEKELLGTGGAIKNAERLINSELFFVFNGDSICKIDLVDFLSFHLTKKALISIVLTNSERSDAGMVKIDNDQRIVKFSEKKGGKENSFTNTGIYVFNRKVLSLIPENRQYSLEYELFPNLTECYGYLCDKSLIDIGTPERYRAAGEMLERN